MATRISFSTHYPDRMGELAGKPTRFPEKILKLTYSRTTYYISECPECGWVGSSYFACGGHQIADTGDYADVGCPKCFTLLEDSDYDFGYYGNSELHPKTTTIRSNYEYWKSKEGQLLQPFFWAGKPYRSKHVVFCPEVRLAKVCKVEIRHFVPNENANTSKWVMYDIHKYGTLKVRGKFLDRKEIEQFTQNEGFDHPDHFWMWFDKDCDGAYLELERVGG